MTQRLFATRFHGFTSTGRTSPARCGCEDEAGNPAGDFVVKLSGAMERGVTAHLCELIASRLAALHFGIPVPEPAIVTMDLDFVQLVANSQQRSNPSAANRIRRSAGLNFASRHLTGVSTWPVDRHIPDAQLESAVDIFAFDALIDNPDRKFSNPNLFTRGNDLIVFDHESAFSFLLAIVPPTEPWDLASTPYLNDHVFSRQLKGKTTELTRFRDALEELNSETTIAGLVAGVPSEWNNGSSLTRIADHLQAVAAHADQFTAAIRRKLA